MIVTGSGDWGKAMAVLAGRDGYEIDDDRTRLDLDVVHGFLVTSYWATGIRRDAVALSIRRSDCYGLYAPDGAQAGMARVVTDGVRFAWLCDVFVLSAHRGRGLGRWLVATALAQLDEAGVSRIILGTSDAHDLYRAHGFTPFQDPGRMMERRTATPAWRDAMPPDGA